MSVARVISPDAFSDISDGEEIFSPMPPSDIFEEPEEHDEDDVTAPWVEVDIHHELTDDEVEDYSFIREIDSESRESIFVGEWIMVDSRMSGSISRNSADLHTPDSLPSYIHNPEPIYWDAQQWLERYANRPNKEEENLFSSDDENDDDMLPSRNCSPLPAGTMDLPRPPVIFDHLPWPPRVVTTPFMERPLDANGKPERPVVYRDNAIGSTDDNAEFYVYATSGQVYMKSGFLADVTPYVDAMNGFNRDKKPLNQRRLEFFRNCEEFLYIGERFSDIIADRVWKAIDRKCFENESELADSINDAKRIPIQEKKLKNRKRRQVPSEPEAKRIKLEEPEEYEDSKENIKDHQLKTAQEIDYAIKRTKMEEPDDYELVQSKKVVKEEPISSEECGGWTAIKMCENDLS